jgi:hypothetical protein
MANLLLPVGCTGLGTTELGQISALLGKSNFPFVHLRGKIDRGQVIDEVSVRGATERIRRLALKHDAGDVDAFAKIEAALEDLWDQRTG